MSVIKELKEFMTRGNVVDMAVGVIIGGAFGKIVSSLVADVIMPPVGLLLSGVNFSELSFVLKEAVNETGQVVPAVTINYGVFLQTLIDFLIISTVIFFAIKAINMLRKKEAAKEDPTPAEPPKPTKEELLAEIRDLLKERNK